MCLHLNFGLKAGFEFKDKAVVVNRDPLDQPPDQTLVVIRHRFLLFFQKGFEFVQPLLHTLAVGVFQKKGLFIRPEIFDLVSQLVKPLLSVGLLQKLFLQGLLATRFLFGKSVVTVFCRSASPIYFSLVKIFFRVLGSQ